MLDLTNPRQGHAAVAPLTVRRSHPSRDRGDRELFARLESGDARAREQLIERFLPLARSVARRYERPGEPIDDLLQVASLALVKAVDRFDTSRGYAFTSFAVPTIDGELKRHFRDRTWSVRPPRDLQELLLRVEQATTRLTQQRDRPPTVAELATALDTTDEQVLDALQAREARTGLSLHAPVSGQDPQHPLQDTLGANDEAFHRAEDRTVIDGLLRHLRARDRKVLRLRFAHDMTQAEIAAIIGVSQMQVSRIIRHALDRLRDVTQQQQRRLDERADRGTRAA